MEQLQRNQLIVELLTQYHFSMYDTNLSFAEIELIKRHSNHRRMYGDELRRHASGNHSEMTQSQRKYDQRIVELLKCPSYQLSMYDTNLSWAEIDLIKRYSKHTWMYGDNVGRDASGNHSGMSVKCIARVNNPSLQAKYKQKLPQMPNISLPNLPYEIRTKTCRGEDRQILPYASITRIDPAKEVLLFHGTNMDYIHKIALEGFSLRHAKGGLYGSNIYLTDCCQKADQYANGGSCSSTGYLAMLLVRVALGNTVKYGTGGGNSQMGGTAVDTNMRFYEFMIPNEEQCLPAYVVIYKRN